MQLAPIVVPAEAPPPDPRAFARRDLPFQFTGTAPEYFRIWIVNTLLTIVTLGVYSAWAKVRSRQYFYRHTFVDGTSFEYLANPVAILKGRMIMGAALTAIVASQQYSMVLYGILLGVLVLMTPWVLVKSLAFNARNSAYRNVRFSFSGGVGEASLLYVKMTLLYLVTCGLGYPYTHFRMTEFVIRGHRFGDRPFHFVARASDYYRIYLVAFAMTVPAYLLLVGLVVALRFAADVGPFIMMPVVLLFYLYLMLPAAYVRAELANLLYGRLHVGEHAFTCKQRAMELAKLYLTNALAVIFTLGLMIPWAQIRTARYRAERLVLHADGDIEARATPGRDASALGDAASDLGDFDLGLGV
jgi:uncharacterized membrane protein YjgN (DUF898 family)